MAAKGFGRRRRRRFGLGIGGAIGGLVLALGVFLFVAGYLGGEARVRLAGQGTPSPVAALFVSGDAGLRFGMGPPTVEALAKHGVTVIGFNSPTLFRFHRTRAETNGLIADMVRQTVRETGQDRLVLIGQSYGADVLQTGLAALPADLRRHVAGIVLVVPGDAVFFRADVSGFAYRGAPDSDGRTTLRTLTWAPVTCIYGRAEADSACPGLKLANATVIGMPGGHFLGHDANGLTALVLAAVRRAAAA